MQATVYYFFVNGQQLVTANRVSSITLVSRLPDVSRET